MAYNMTYWEGLGDSSTLSPSCENSVSEFNGVLVELYTEKEMTKEEHAAFVEMANGISNERTKSSILFGLGMNKVNTPLLWQRRESNSVETRCGIGNQVIEREHVVCNRPMTAWGGGPPVYGGNHMGGGYPVGALGYSYPMGALGGSAMDAGYGGWGGGWGSGPPMVNPALLDALLERIERAPLCGPEIQNALVFEDAVVQMEDMVKDNEE